MCCYVCTYVLHVCVFLLLLYLAWFLFSCCAWKKTKDTRCIAMTGGTVFLPPVLSFYCVFFLSYSSFFFDIVSLLFFLRFFMIYNIDKYIYIHVYVRRLLVYVDYIIYLFLRSTSKIIVCLVRLPQVTGKSLLSTVVCAVMEAGGVE